MLTSFDLTLEELTHPETGQRGLPHPSKTEGFWLCSLVSVHGTDKILNVVFQWPTVISMVSRQTDVVCAQHVWIMTQEVDLGLGEVAFELLNWSSQVQAEAL